MKKIILLLLIADISIITTKANPVDVQIAQSVGARFLSANTKIQLRGSSDLQLATTYNINNNAVAFYIFNAQNGFVIVAGDDCATPILGYSDQGRFDVDNIPVQLQDILQDYVRQMQYAADNHVVANETIDRHWLMVKDDGRLNNNRNKNQVGPLLTTTWDQFPYYNTLSPGHSVTGCVATAMAQIIKYHGYPQHGRGIHSYHSPYGQLTINFEESDYDYDNMPDMLTAESTDEEVYAVAKLMYDCGVALSMHYGIYESAAVSYQIIPALINHFCYSPTIWQGRRVAYDDDSWHNLIRNNLDASMPIFYESNGHEYIIDGYDDNRFYHFNLGWGGGGDGWYTLYTILGVEWDYFMYDQYAIMDVFPANNSNGIIVGDDNHNEFTVSAPMDFYNSSNKDVFVNQYGGTYVETLVLRPSVPSQQLVLYFMNYKNETIEVYDGVTTDFNHLLRTVDHPQSDFSPVVSTQHALTVRVVGAPTFNGFHMRITKDNMCRMVYNLTATVNESESTVHLSWYGYGSSWRVEYGPKGFVQGEGTAITANVNNVTINVDNPNDTYEFRVQPECDVLNNYLINSIVINEKRYWSDVVTEQPEGYQVAADGTIVISSAEGFGWLSKISQQEWVDGDVSLENDIDLSGYFWKPINMKRNGNIYGNGHVISNMKVYEEELGVGLFYNLGTDTVFDLGFNRAQICSYLGEAGAISANGNPTVINCYSINHAIDGYAVVGGLCGLGGKLINCYSRGNIGGKDYAGGLVGKDANAIVNCYTSVTDMAGYYMNMGLLTGDGENGAFINCYSDIDYIFNHWSEDTIGYFLGGNANLNQVARNLVGFTRQGNQLAYTVPSVSVNYQYGDSIDLVTALNQWVVDANSPMLRTWVWDEATKYPKFGDYLDVSYPNVSNLTATNIPYEDGFAVDLSWKENGSAEEWQIRCLPYGVIDNDSAMYYTTYTDNAIITGLTFGKKYDFYVRPVYDVSTPVTWGFPLTHVFDNTNGLETDTFYPDGFVLYPNPAKERLYIESQMIVRQIDIYNILGLLIYSTESDSENIEIDTKSLNPGMYVIQVISDGYTEKQRFIKM